MAKADKSERKLPKLPKSLGACVDLYHATRERRLAENKKVDEIKADETYIANHVIDNVPKGEAGVIGAKFKGVVKSETVYQVEDWDKFYAWIKKNDAFEVLNRAVNQASVKEHVDALNYKLDIANAKVKDVKDRKPRKLLPGMKTFTALKLSVTKI